MWHIFKALAILFYVSELLLVIVAGRKNNVTLAEMSTCKEHDLNDTGYKYQQYFKVQSLDNNKVSNDERLHLKFYVVTPMDAHILLSVTDRPRSMDKVYEIVIGAGGNKFSTIRACMGRRRIATNEEPAVLSEFGPNSIEIIQNKDGNLLVFLPGFKEEPLLNYTDPSPLNISYFSFSSYGSVSARWFYDCLLDGFESEMEQESNEQEITSIFIEEHSVVFSNATPSVLKIQMHLLLFSTLSYMVYSAY